jgi:hypothetical protein
MTLYLKLFFAGPIPITKGNDMAFIFRGAISVSPSRDRVNKVELFLYQ